MLSGHDLRRVTAPPARALQVYVTMSAVCFAFSFGLEFATVTSMYFSREFLYDDGSGAHPVSKVHSCRYRLLVRGWAVIR